MGTSNAIERLGRVGLALVASLGLLGASFADGKVRYEYDRLDRLTRVEYPDGTTIEYTCDAAGNVTSVVTKPPASEPPSPPAPPRSG